MKKPTITGLQKDLAAANDEAKGYMERVSILKDENRNLEAKLKETRADFADLKQRLHAAETSNQYMRGYLARVQEDDTVREELLTVGEPDGEQRMVPKRKPTEFLRPNDFSEPRRGDMGMSGYLEHRARDRKPRHWITY